MTWTRRRFLRISGAAVAAPLFSKLSAGTKKEPSELCQKLAADPLRPQYHLLPASNWMNDPNGPIYFRGRYHMFYQYNPKGAVWGNMNWAHASSKDMVYWRHEPIAISPTDGGFDSAGVFSGTAALDKGVPTVIYTAVAPPPTPEMATIREPGHLWREVQLLAVSHDDDLIHWDKSAEPVILSPPPGLDVAGFRDPFMWKDGNSWLLGLGSGVRGQGGKVLLYESADLRRWTYLHPLYESAVKTGKDDMWECPDFFPLGTKHVLLFSADGKVWWKVGTYKDRRFTPEKEGVVDFGAFYAAKSMLDEDGNRILWGWIPERRPEAEHSAAGWAGVMALPRLLSLTPDGELQSEVIEGIHKLRHGHTGLPKEAGAAARNQALESFRIEDLAAELSMEFRLRGNQPFTVRLRSEDGESFAAVTCVNKDGGRELSVNGSAAPLPGSADSLVRLQLFLDGSVLEAFANGTTALTSRIYGIPKWPLVVRLEGDAVVDSLDIWRMQPISKDRLTGSLCR